MINEADCGTIVPAGNVAAALQELRRYRDLPPTERRTIGARGKTWLLENRRYETLAAQYETVLKLPTVAKDYQ